MNLVFYGGGHEWENDHLDLEAIKLSGKKNPSVTYIPAGSYESEIEFRGLITQYSKYGITKFIHFPIDVYFDQTLKQEALSSDIIHLGGGNTFYFLKHLKKTGIFLELKKFVKNGGILTGLSAGGIVMSPSVKTASFPSFDCDDNDEKLKNLSAMKLVDFEFFPHYKNSKRYDKELLDYSKTISHPLYASPDGSGISVTNNSIKFLGKNYMFHQGRKVMIHK